MDLKLGTYLVYLAVSIVLTVWVARTLKRNGQVFLDDAFEDERLAESVNHLLVVGFYLLNLGYVAVALKISKATLDDGSEAMEALAMKLGFVLLVLGAVHFFNLYVLSRFRRRRMLEKAAPPVLPGRMMAPVGAPLAAPVPVPPFPYAPPRNPAPPANRPTSPYSGPTHPAPGDPAPPR
ncbi:hypothetical protein [Dactylosporangium darangshiense]|uniref:Integral membrane protein n=1 Tax=Dactylosporangium darangshiense TaxID=579108 RepID=A0ABP8DDK6_9ACTN